MLDSKDPGTEPTSRSRSNLNSQDYESQEMTTRHQGLTLDH